MKTEGKKIEVRYDDVSTYELSEDGDFRCLHERAEVTPPCCSTVGSSGYIECGCGGLYSVYCPDCDYMNMPDYEVNDLIESLTGERSEDLAYV